MKIFIVFLGILLLNVSIMSYKSDYGKYAYLHKSLDNIAFECAEIAVLNPEEAQGFADGLLEYTAGNLRNVKVRNYTCEIYDRDGSTTVLIRMDVEKLFRFPYSAVTTIVAEKRI